MTVLALLIAVLLHEGVRGWRVHRGAVFFPYILPCSRGRPRVQRLPAVQRRPQRGSCVPSVSAALAKDWLGSPGLAIWSVGGVVVWQQLGFGVVVFLAALLSLPHEVIEAARLDGVSWWQLQTRVQIPQIRTHHRVLRRHRGDHGAVVGVHLRLRHHRRRARQQLHRHGVLHLEERFRAGIGGAGERRGCLRPGPRRSADRRRTCGCASAPTTQEESCEAVHSSPGRSCSSLVTVAALAPLTFMLLTSLKTPEDYQQHPFGLPTSPTLANYVSGHRGPAHAALGDEQHHRHRPGGRGVKRHGRARGLRGHVRPVPRPRAR